MNVQRVIDEVLDELGDDVAAAVRGCVRFRVRERPGPRDLELGADHDWSGYFHGVAVGEHQAADVYAYEGDELGEVRCPVGGVIAIFTANIRPLTEDNVREVVLHELAHFFGEGEDQVAAAGLGDGESVVELEGWCE